MGNIFEIQNDILSIINTLEENGGEFTPELEETLNIKRDELKDKVNAYANVIKQLEGDIALIKEEKNRLNDLQKRKESTIDKLKNILVYAINNFGETTKAGGKVIDYGIGKVSLKNSESIEIDDKLITRFSNRVLTYYHWLLNTKQLDVEETNIQTLLEYCNSLTPIEEDEGYVKEEIPNITEEDLKQLNFTANLDINLLDALHTEEGQQFIKAFIRYSSTGGLVPNPNKNEIKRVVKEEHKLPIYATLKQKQNVIIK